MSFLTRIKELETQDHLMKVAFTFFFTKFNNVLLILFLFLLMRSVFRYLEIHVIFGCTDFVLYRWHMVLDTLLSTGSGNSLSPVNSLITIEPYEHIFENTKLWNE